jgi:predicted O-methyltransferase YrrM
MSVRTAFLIAATAVLTIFSPAPAPGSDAIDERVEAVLEKMRGQWRDMNVPEQDGRLLYEIVLEKGYKSAVEVGTSTGHSTLWIAWALHKTGGKLVTLEIDGRRHREAVKLLDEAGLSDVVDARLGDAHDLVKELPGPYDFVFLDADKGWYTNYARDLIPKLEPGGCLSAHNVHEPGTGRRRGMWGTAEYLEFMKGQPGFETQVLPDSVNGISVSYKASR